MPACLDRLRSLAPKAEKLLHGMGLGDRLDYLTHQLSIGQKRRVAVARALLLDPLVVFADEPTNDLDPERAAWIGELLFAQPPRERALVLVTHDAGLASRADRAVQIVDGRVRDLPVAALKTG